MTETVILGIYIEERLESLISAGRVATGIVGVVGTAANGPTRMPFALSGLADAQDRSRLPVSFDRPEVSHNPLKLLGVLRHIRRSSSTVDLGRY